MKKPNAGPNDPDGLEQYAVLHKPLEPRERPPVPKKGKTPPDAYSRLFSRPAIPEARYQAFLDGRAQGLARTALIDDYVAGLESARNERREEARR